LKKYENPKNLQNQVGQQLFKPIQFTPAEPIAMETDRNGGQINPA
jgi:hypothetical protein